MIFCTSNTKRNILLSCFIFSFLLLNTPSFGQLYIAPKVGINGVTSFNETEGLNFKFEKGYQFGIEAGHTFYNFIGLRMEVMYANKAFSLTAEKVKQEDNGESSLFTENLKIKNGTFQINGAIQIKIGEKFELSACPQMDLLLSSSGNGSLYPTNNIDSTQIVNYDYINDIEGQGAYWNVNEKDGNFFNSAILGINMGVNIQVLPRLHLDIRSNYTVSKLVNDFYVSDPNAFGTSDIELTFTASYRIPIKKKHKKEEEEKELLDENKPNEKSSDGMR